MKIIYEESLYKHHASLNYYKSIFFFFKPKLLFYQIWFYTIAIKALG